MAENKPINFVSKNNRTYLSLLNQYGKCLPWILSVYGTSGSGKGLAEEGIIEKWQQTTEGIVLFVADPKNECEGSFAQYLPKEPYHTERLKLDGIIPKTHPVKIYHPFTFSAPLNMKLPEINWYTLPIKRLSREEFGILTESSFDNESTKLLMRVSDSLTKDEGLFDFLHKVNSFASGKKEKKKSVPDPNNFYLPVGGGTAKSIVEVVGLMSPFKKDYFLRKESCPYALNWRDILTDNKNYHVFVSMWLKDEKQQQFTVVSLIQQIIANAQDLANKQILKKPILIVIPEVRKLTPGGGLVGFKYFLAQTLVKTLSTCRSIGKGISVIMDSQCFDDVYQPVRDTSNVTLFGNLSPGDAERVVKTMGYKREIREQLTNMNANSFFVAGMESENPCRIFMPSHAHKEVPYNWIEMYEQNFPEKMKKYTELVKYMRSEYEKEEQAVKKKVEEKEEQERLEFEEQQKAKEDKKNKKEQEIPKKIEEKASKNEETIMRLCYEMFNDESIPKRDRTFRKIGQKVNKNHSTVASYIKKWEKKLEDSKKIDRENINQNIGSGVLPEEIDSNYGVETQEEEFEEKTLEETENEMRKKFSRNKEEDSEEETDIEPDEEGVIYNSSEHKKLANPNDTEFDYLNESQSEDEED